MKILSNHEYKLLVHEIDYWRTQYEKERERADRIYDTALESRGMPAVSE